MEEREILMLERRRKNIKLREIAKAIGCSISLLSRWERGECHIAPEKLRRYREFLIGGNNDGK
ncbi:helix-turn-helix domain-containing protein [Thermosediminibacter oceani]|uniref:Helix-turn-helix domain protein n=1 Tax=Thermosediminibacter oceani (strain ATCC BAA-1034 / DSM 16646 / JW/IW-1228P) TaxID=555079 RepID=D9S2X8_THEOJ|nr:helix-turn-helix transcriptional regulator [Thermosediminibacter oceani]ADL07755.1 helix-turn-helix domain protein [Thermosediminibacter oceani DSM 16646]